MLTYTTHAPIGGTGLAGYITIEKSVLEALLGPSEGPSGDGKVKESWSLTIVDEDGYEHRVTIYDYKNYHLQELSDDFVDWHVGGNSHMAPDLLRRLLIQLTAPKLTN